MKIFIFTLLLSFALLLGGCGSMGRAAESLDRQLDRAEEKVESAVEDALFVPATEIPAAPAAAAQEITAEQAKDIALTHAGLSAQQVKYLRSEYEIDDGFPQYEVNFHQDRWEYDYEIDARTGNILSFERDD